MSQRPIKSIDGILPAQPRRGVYIARVPLKAQPTRMVSMQARPISDTLPPLPALPKSDFRQNDVVVRLPRSRVLFARVSSIIQYVLIAAVALVSAGNSTIGQYFVLAFAIYVLVRRKNSQTTFMVALLLLISIPFFQLLRQTGVADNMAIYTYELLVVGTIQAIIELKWPTVYNKVNRQ